MKTTYIITRSSKNTLIVKTMHDDEMTSLFGSYDASKKNMSGNLGSWEGDFPRRAADIVKLGMTITVGQTAELVDGETATQVARTYPYDPIKAAEWDNLHNEGGEGYNPYR